MAEINFYHLSTTSIEQTLPKVLEKILGLGSKAIILCESQKFIDVIDEALWSVGGTRFIPHGTEKDDFKDQQPIFLTLKKENINNADFLVSTFPLDDEFNEKFKKTLIFFNGAENSELDKSRALWKKYKANSEHKLKYFIQDEKGSWSEKL